MDISVITAPVVGAIIGYITNELAIKMLFHPRKAIYIGKFRLPFTPGLIPKEQKRIAHSLASAISTQLLTESTLKKSLLSEDIYAKTDNAVQNFFEKCKNNNRSVEECAAEYIDANGIEDIKNELQKHISAKIIEAVNESNLPSEIASYAEEQIKLKAGGFMSMFLPMLGGNIREYIESTVQNILLENLEPFTKKAVGKKLDELCGAKICDLTKEMNGGIDYVKSAVRKAYANLIENRLDKILDTVNIEKTVEEKILWFDVAEFEDLIFGLMKKELRAIIYLGAILGALIGFINLVI